MAADDKPRLLIVEDDPGLQRQLKWCFDQYEVLMASTRSEALVLLRRFEPPVVLQDLGLPPTPEDVTEGMHTLREILSLAPQTKVIVVTGNSDRDNAVRAVSLGAYDFYQKPVDTEVLRLIVSRAFHMHTLEEQNRQLRETQFPSPLEGLIATDNSMSRVLRMVEKVAASPVSVLVVGESGTGKELVARALHARSGRTDYKFVQVNCSAMPATLLEKELFESESAQTAEKPARCKLELAQGGTLFIDEIGDMSAAAQTRLLEFLQSRTIRKSNGERVALDVRVVSATSKDLQTLIAEQKFNQDLYYSIAEALVEVPPLRERPGGATVLAHALLRKYNGMHGQPRKGFTDAALSALESYGWPGNIRELENKVKTALLMAQGSLITPENLGLEPSGSNELLFNLKEVRARAERQAIQQALSIVNGNISRSAELLGVSRPTLYDLMEKYGIKQD
ncbi:MAG: PEP-CTERM-box response regulator transcription factor [Povalibacter sp.]